MYSTETEKGCIILQALGIVLSIEIFSENSKHQSKQHVIHSKFLYDIFFVLFYSFLIHFIFCGLLFQKSILGVVSIEITKAILADSCEYCSDYITEKLWKVLQVGAVPVYFGAPNVQVCVLKVYFHQGFFTIQVYNFSQIFYHPPT